VKITNPKQKVADQEVITNKENIQYYQIIITNTFTTIVDYKGSLSAGFCGYYSANNSDVVVRSYRAVGSPPTSTLPQFYFVECLDYMFHRHVPDLVISPSLDPGIAVPNKKFARVAAIVRKQYKPVEWRKKPIKVVVMLSGSAFGSPVELSQDSYPFQIDIIGRCAPKGWKETNGITYHSKLLDNADLLNEADLVVVNGGFSAVSEAFCMQKPMVVIPVPRHAEQWVNARTVEHLGVGVMSDEENLEKQLLAAFDRIDDLRQAYKRLPDWHAGAEQAAVSILNFVKGTC